MDQSLKSAGDGNAPASASQTGLSKATHSGGFCVSLPQLPLRAGHLLMPQVIDLYMAHYAGRDPTRQQRLHWWSNRLQQCSLSGLSDDEVHAALEDLANQHSRYYAGLDADGRPVYRAKKKPLAPATINRYCASLAAVVTWTIKKRIAPKGFVHPCRSVERRQEHNEKTRFLTDDERSRLLVACKSSSWDRLYLLVLMALTTGARKSELTGLTWRDIDMERGTAHVQQTKNGDPRILPLVPAVCDELRKLGSGAPSSHIFASSRNARSIYSFESKFHDALKAAHIKGVTFHTLRHSCASALARQGATLLEIGDLLGHRQLQMTKRYSHLATSHKQALVNRLLGDVS